MLVDDFVSAVPVSDLQSPELLALLSLPYSLEYLLNNNHSTLALVES